MGKCCLYTYLQACEGRYVRHMENTKSYDITHEKQNENKKCKTVKKQDQTRRLGKDAVSSKTQKLRKIKVYMTSTQKSKCCLCYKY